MVGLDPRQLVVPAIITTDRLVLVCPHAGDGKVINEAIMDSLEELKTWMPFATPAPSVEESERFVVETAVAFRDRRGFGYRIVDRMTGLHAGNAGIHSVNWSVPSGEIGYWIRTRFTNRGYASEATRALAEMAFDVLCMERVAIRCDSRNVASRRVAEKAGFRFEGTLRHDSRSPVGELRDSLVFGMTRADFDRLRKGSKE